MADHANDDARQLGTVAADHQTIVRVAHAFVAGKADIAEAENMLATAKKQHVHKIREALVGVRAVTEDEWSLSWKPVVEQTLKDKGYAEKSVPVTASNLKVVVIAITNGITPNADETYTKFLERGRKACQDNGLLKATGAGRKKEGEGEKVSPKPSPREEALWLLARGGDSEMPDEQVRRRARALDYLLTTVGWEELIKFAAEKGKQLNKPLQVAA